MLFLTEKANGVILNVHVIPGSARSEIVGLHEDALRIKIAAPPVEGRANAECIRFLSDTLGIRKNQITITHGRTSRKKTISLDGISAREVLSVFKDYGI
jgi:uncharacterized protein